MALSANKKIRKRSRVDLEEQEQFKLKTKEINPLTLSQEDAFDYYDEGNHLVFHGIAGTGKTFISLYLALNDILDDKSKYDKILIVRSVVQSRDIGFLPGNVKDKISIYEMPYENICNELFTMKNSYAYLKNKNKVEFQSTSFIRGLTFDNTILIIDEMQNMTAMELHSILTRIGKNSKFIMCGDYRQNDLLDKKNGQSSGLPEILKVLELVKSVKIVNFGIDDIVRSGFVKEYIIARDRLGLS